METKIVALSSQIKQGERELEHVANIKMCTLKDTLTAHVLTEVQAQIALVIPRIAAEANSVYDSRQRMEVRSTHYDFELPPNLETPMYRLELPNNDRTHNERPRNPPRPYVRTTSRSSERSSNNRGREADVKAEDRKGKRPRSPPPRSSSSMARDAADTKKELKAAIFTRMSHLPWHNSQALERSVEAFANNIIAVKFEKMAVRNTFKKHASNVTTTDKELNDAVNELARVNTIHNNLTNTQ
jgi:hypothetical protein